MSVFRVKLQNTDQGQLDMSPPTNGTAVQVGANDGTPFTTSVQRQVYIMGPNKCNRLLSDGDIFTDCNFYKQFCYPQCSLERAILECVIDDGSVWPQDNTTPVVLNFTVLNGTDFGDNTYNMVTAYGGPAIFCQIENQSGADDVTVRLNGLSAAVFTLAAGATQIFNAGDLTITEVAFANTASGGGDVPIQMILSVESTCNT